MKKSKIVVVFMTVMTLLLQSFVPASTYGVEAAAGSDISEHITYDNIVLKVGDKELPNADVQIEDNTLVMFSLGWTMLDSIGLKEGDYTIFQLPLALQNIPNNFFGDLMDGDLVIGDFLLTPDGVLKFTFNSELIGKEDRVGEFGLSLSFNLDVFEEDIYHKIEFEDANHSIQVEAKPKQELKEVDKTGELEAAINPTFIDWKIEVNAKRDALKNLVLTDKIPAGLELDLDSVEIFELNVGINKNTKGKKLDAPLPKFAKDNFTIDFGDTDKSYLVEYKTNIVAYPEEGYTNEAIITSGVDDKFTSKVKIDKIERPDAIEKSGMLDKDKDANEITWTLDINKGQEVLNKVTVEDTLPKGTTLKSITVFKLVSKGTSWVEEKTDLTFDSFPLDFGDIDKEAYRVKVVTTIDESDTYTSSEVFENTVILKTDGIKRDEDTATVTVKRSPILEKGGIETTDYGTPKISWTVKVNGAKHSIINAKVVDRLGAGHELIQDSVVVKDSTGKVVDKGKYTISYNPLTISLGDINDSYTITYDSKITDANLTSFENKVQLSGDGLKGDGIGVGDGIIEVGKVIESTVKNVYNKEVLSNLEFEDQKYDGLNYTEQTMSWKLSIDSKKEKITKLTISDTFIQEKSMLFLEDTLVVAKRVNGVMKKVDSSEYILTPKGVNGFTLEFKGELDRTLYQVYYKTSFDPDKVIEAGGTPTSIKKLINQAVFDVETENLEGKSKVEKITKDASYTLKDDVFNSGKKIGELVGDSERTIKWTIFVNELGQDLSGEPFTITDKLSKGHVFNNNIEIFEYTLDKNGNEILADTPTEIKYKYDYDTDGFTMVFEDGITKPYAIQFTSSAVGVSIPEYTNEATVKGKLTDKLFGDSVHYPVWSNFVEKTLLDVVGGTVYTDDELNWEVKLNQSLSEIKNTVFKDQISSGHVYLEGSLKVFDGETEIKLPEGAISFVIDENDNTQLSVILGDISKLLTVTYTTVVITNTGTISNVASLVGDQLDEPASSEKSYSAVQFSWGTGSGKESRGSLEVSKVDMDTQDLLINNLPTFELSYQLNGEKRIVDGLEKAAGGAIFRVGNLPYRTYTLTEIAAPNGYKLLEEPIEIIIDKEHKEIKLSVENERIKADVEARKTWVGGPSEKPDVWFKLYRNVEGGVAEAVVDLDIKLIQGNDTVTWNQLPVTDTEGKTYIYSVKEVGATGNPLTLDTYFSYENGLEVINTYLIPTNATALAEKVWMGGPEEHPTIWFKLYRSVLDEDMVEVPGAEVKILEYGTTSVEWNSLEETDFNGNPYTFHVKEVDAEGLDYTPEFYEKLEDGLRVTNIHESLKRDITVEKVWVKAPEIKPTIEIQLYRNGVEYGDSVLFIDGITEHTFYGLPVEDENGDLYEYTVDEVNVPEDYSKTVDGFTITNTLERGVQDAGVKPTEPGKVLPATGSVGVLPFAYFFIALSGITYLGGKKIKKRD